MSGVSPVPYHYQYSMPLPGYRSQSATPDFGLQDCMDIERERMDVLVKNFHGSIGVLYSERSTFFKQLANNIKGYYSTSFNFRETEIINYDEPLWLETSVQYSHLIFIGIPPAKKKTTRKGKAASLDSSSREEELMSRGNRLLSTVVVIQPFMPRGKAEKKGHYLERFFHLSLQQPSELTRLAQAAFAIFSGKWYEHFSNI